MANNGFEGPSLKTVTSWIPGLILVYGAWTALKVIQKVTTDIGQLDWPTVFNPFAGFSSVGDALSAIIHPSTAAPPERIGGDATPAMPNEQRLLDEDARLAAEGKCRGRVPSESERLAFYPWLQPGEPFRPRKGTDPRQGDTSPYATPVGGGELTSREVIVDCASIQ